MVRAPAVIADAAAHAQIAGVPIDVEAIHAQADHVAVSDDDQGYGRRPVAVAARECGQHGPARRQVDVPCGGLLRDIPGRRLLVRRIENALRESRGGQAGISDEGSQSGAPPKELHDFPSAMTWKCAGGCCRSTAADAGAILAVIAQIAIVRA